MEYDISYIWQYEEKSVPTFMVISLFAIPYIKSRKWLKTFIIIGIAIMIHKSAFIIIFLYFIAALEWKPMTYAAALLATFASAGLLKATPKVKHVNSGT